MTFHKVDTEKCIGCRACEIACSYHHRRVFNPRMASLEIQATEESPYISVVLYEDMSPQQREGRFPCDHCRMESEALCIKYCPVGAIELDRRGEPCQ